MLNLPENLDSPWEPWTPKTGTVVDGTVELIAGHNHWVQLDAYWWYPNWPGGTLPIGFAAIELEPLEPVTEGEWRFIEEEPTR